MKAKTHINKEGYLVFDDSGRYVHRWVAEKKYGKEKVKDKEVHHIDGNKINNDKSNLVLLEKEDHYYVGQYENRIKFISSIIIGLAGFYLILINLLMYTSLLNEEISLTLARLSVFFILIFTLELKYGFIRKWIRSPKSKDM